MRLSNLKVGDFVARECWLSIGEYKGYLPSPKNLTVTKKANGEFWYCENFIPTKPLRKDSSGYTRTDFIIVKENVVMQYEKNIIVINDKGVAKGFIDEDGALDFIQLCMDEGQRAKYKIYQAYKVVEPQRLDVMAMVRKL